MASRLMRRSEAVSIGMKVLGSLDKDADVGADVAVDANMAATLKKAPCL